MNINQTIEDAIGHYLYITDNEGYFALTDEQKEEAIKGIKNCIINDKDFLKIFHLTIDHYADRYIANHFDNELNR